MNNKTISKLRDSIDGKIYVYFEDNDICKIFLKNAKNEGFMFGDRVPCETDTDEIIAVEKDKQLSHAGFVGRMAFQTNGGDGGNLARVDYAKYVNGGANFFFETPPFKMSVAEGKFFKNITIVGDNADMAVGYIAGKVCDCNDREEEFNLYEETETKFGVSIFIGER